MSAGKLRTSSPAGLQIVFQDPYRSMIRASRSAKSIIEGPMNFASSATKLSRGPGS